MRTLKTETKRCEECTKNFEGSFNQKFCEVPCRRSYTKKFNSSTRLIKEEDQVSCLICGIVFKGNLNSHLTIHGINTKEYLVQFPEAKLYSESYLKHCSDRITGNKNPAYDHGGRLSPFSDKFVGYKNLSDEETQTRIQEVHIKRADTTDKNDNYTNRLSYYLKQGMSEDEANDALLERQTTFSLEKCIEKYGQEEGQARWNKRQEQWLTNYKKSNYSKISQLLFWEIFNVLEDTSSIYFAELSPKKIRDSSGKNNELRLNLATKVILPDFIDTKKKKIIEFDGDYWHGKPGNVQRELDRDMIIVDNGYQIIHITETEFKTDKKKVIEKCLNFMIS